MMCVWCATMSKLCSMEHGICIVQTHYNLFSMPIAMVKNYNYDKCIVNIHNIILLEFTSKQTWLLIWIVDDVIENQFANFPRKNGYGKRGFM